MRKFNRSHSVQRLIRLVVDIRSSHSFQASVSQILLTAGEWGREWEVRDGWSGAVVKCVTYGYQKVPETGMIVNEVERMTDLFTRDERMHFEMKENDNDSVRCRGRAVIANNGIIYHFIILLILD